MNQQLKAIQDFIQQNQQLSQQEKETLLKSVKDADKAFSISEFKLERTEKVKRTTAILLEETIEELENKRKAIEEKNHELEIENALEKVRAIALSMKELADMPEVCRIIATELDKLGVKEIRNVQTAIFYESKGTYMNYEYYFKHDKKIITETSYTNNETHKAFAGQMLKGKGEFFSTFISKAELHGWIAYQKTTNVFIDTYLETAPSLSYYWFSLGPVALGISTYTVLSEEAINLFKRFLKVFELAYRRFLDIEQAMQQAREAKIEAALESVRASSMAMHHSEELEKVVKTLSDKLIDLGLSLDGAFIFFFEKEKRNLHLWVATNHLPAPIKVDMPYAEDIQNNPIIRNLWEAIETGGDFINESYSGKVKDDYFRYVAKYNESKIPEAIRKFQLETECWTVSFAAGKNSVVGIDSWSGKFITQQDFQVLKRFAKVFEQAYTRFLDLQKAEAQAREATIEAALERTRTQSMIMQHSKELDDTLRVFHEQVQLLGINSAFSFLWLPDEDKDKHIFWAIWEENKNGSIVFKNKAINYPLDRDEPATRQCLIDWKGDEPVVSYAVPPERVKNYFAAWQELIDGVETLKPEHFHNGLYYVEAFMKYGCFGVMMENDLNESEKKILGRIAIEFERTYTRFLDLQKAEGQAREAQIEAALESVRSASLAMHHSNQLKTVAAVMFKRLMELGLTLSGAFIFLFDRKTRDIQLWIATTTLSEPGEINIPYTLAISKNLIFKDLWNVIENGEQVFNRVYSGKEKNDYFRHVGEHNTFPQDLKDFHQKAKSWITSIAGEEHAALGFDSWDEQLATIEDFQILKRFSKVFEQAYVRFLDLQKAEAQAREAKIEAALERVRSKSMAMHHSESLHEVINAVTEQFKQLGFYFDTANFITNYSNEGWEWWISTPGAETPAKIYFPQADLKFFRQFTSAIRQGSEFTAFSLSHEEKNELFKHIFENTILKNSPEERKQYVYNTKGLAFSTAFFKNIFLSIANYQAIAYSEDENNIIRRFGRVFEQTYTRFLDLQKAETNAREAKIEAALERVRSRTLAMQKSDELAETAAVLFKQLINLGIEPNRLYINIVKDETGEAEFWITDEDGSKVSMAYTDNMNNNLSFKKMFEGWKQQKKSLVIDMKGKELQQYFKYLSSIHVPFKGGLAQKRRLQYIAYFSKGFIGMASPEEQPAETLQLLERFAYVFNLTFTRFSDLQIAEAHALQAEQDLIAIKAAKQKAEDALNELQLTQKQLVQSEKMASLGELTAGIAHEIQNPLNFVNNFSEVNYELISELVDEADKGNIDEVKAIANDIKSNEEKINHHGKRADAIVKGMLQHSRKSEGVKEPTDINALCDEYLRLSYHGLRAKDKSFNADFKTDFDETIGKISIVPQDIGRVLLNLFNNAFYAVNEKKKTADESYKPLVSVSIKKINNKVEIKVEDNGNGIPQNIVEKIFQPFFTTKPTGQGTGLGLSLSYDIIKAHGGEIKVETKEGEGSKFIIQLPVA